MVHIYDGILLCHKKKNEILPFATAWMDLWGIMLRNKSERESQILYDFTHMWNLNSEINKQSRHRLTDTENKLMIAGWERVWGTG